MAMALNSCCVVDSRLRCAFKWKKKKKMRAMVNCEARELSKLVTFIGKGGVGKTFSAVTAAQYYSSIGLRTCLVVQSQDITADSILGHKLNYTPTLLNDGLLTAIRLESTKLVMEPLGQLKKADDRLNFSQGAMQEMKGSEMSILVGMDSMMALAALDKFTGFARQRRTEYDVVVYDGASSDETLRMFGTADRLRWYLTRFRELAGKSDVGRVALPSIMKLIEASVRGNSSASERSTSELWDEADAVLQGLSGIFQDPKRFCCYIVTDPSNRITEECALRYWGCTLQAGLHVSGVVHVAKDNGGDDAAWKEKYRPLDVAELPKLPLDEQPCWEDVVISIGQSASRMLRGERSDDVSKSVSFNLSDRTVSCFLPGFDKREVKLSQVTRNDLLIEAGDQRRLISLPNQLCGKVLSAKFSERCLIVTLKTN